MVGLKDTTPGVNIENALNTIVTNAEVSLNRLVSLATDAAPAVVGSKAGRIIKNTNFPNFLPVHCIVHCEYLTANYSKYEEVTKTILEMVNFMRKNVKTRRELRNFINELNLENKLTMSHFTAL